MVAEICSRLLGEDWLDLNFVLDGTLDRYRGACGDAWMSAAGTRLTGAEQFPSADALRERLHDSGALSHSVGLYTDHRPAQKLYSWEGKIVYDLSMLLTPECHPATSIAMYTTDLAEQIALSDVLFPISEATARDLGWVYGVSPERLKVALLGNNVDLGASARMRQLVSARQVEPFLLILGSIEPRKNAALVLEHGLRATLRCCHRCGWCLRAAKPGAKVSPASLRAESLQPAAASGRDRSCGLR